MSRRAVRVTAVVLVAGLVLGTVGGAVGLPGPALVAVLVLGVGAAVAFSLRGRSRR